MRAKVVYLFLCFLLLCGGNHLYANSSQGSTNFSLAQIFKPIEQVKNDNSNHNSIIIESSDIELDEDFHSSEDFNDVASNKILAHKSNGVNNWYLTISNEVVYKENAKNNKHYQSPIDCSNSIYLKIGVLRI